MSPSHWRRIEELYHLAREHPRSERSAFVRDACAHDEELKRTVELLLAQDDRSGPLERPVATLLPGQRLGRYRVLEKIGAGGMGEVYRAHDDHLERDVALKILPTSFMVDEPVRRRFRREALALSKLNHPNIATVFDFDTEDEISFIAMEMIQGAPLSQRVETGVLEEKETVCLGIQLADGLAAAHAQGVIHRDLKPANLMVTPEGRLKILDFGLAVLAASEAGPDATRSMSETAAIVGTLPYMAPEQLRGQPVDTRTDVYSAGAVLYEMITGQRAFPESQSAELIGAILHRSPASPRTMNPRISLGLQRVVMKSLEKEPARRYQSARELSSALEQSAARKLTLAPPILAGVAAAVLLGGLLIGWNVGGIRDRVFRREKAQTRTAAPARRSVAVLGFQNLSGRADAAWLSTGLSEMFTTELSAGEKLRTIPGENVARARMDLRLPETDSLARDTLARLRSNLGADLVVLGSYLDLGKDTIRNLKHAKRRKRGLVPGYGAAEIDLDRGRAMFPNGNRR
jgi:TolB-like protein